MNTATPLPAPSGDTGRAPSRPLSPPAVVVTTAGDAAAAGGTSWIYDSAIPLAAAAPLAQDVVQAAFLRIYHRIDQFDITRPFAPWFMRAP